VSLQLSKATFRDDARVGSHALHGPRIIVA
jgi:hypothetical protein